MESPIMKMIFGDKDLSFFKDAYRSAYDKDITDDEEVSELCHWENILKLMADLIMGTTEIEEPHEAAIPKDDGSGDMRIVLVGGKVERFLCPAIARAINRLLPELTHSSCKSYQEKIGTGIPVRECSKAVQKVNGNVVGGKYDFHHYFDTVLKKWVFYFFDLIEEKLGMPKNSDPAINYIRKIYDNDWLIDVQGKRIQRWSGIRQGNAMGCVLANILLYELDEFMSMKYDFYVRYSDDLIVVTPDVDGATKDILSIVSKYGVELNLKKTQVLKKNEYFTFLGFSIRGDSITISKKRLNNIVREIRRCCNYMNSPKKALKLLMKYFYNPYGEYSLATSILPVVNCEEDLHKIDYFAMDCWRALKFGKTHKKHTGGLGYVSNQKVGVIDRGKGTSVKTDKQKQLEVDGYLSLAKMRKAYITNKAAYRTLVRSVVQG